MDKIIATVAGASIALLVILMSLPTMLLWNYLMPDLFGLKEISFWQALALNTLCHIMFKSSSSSSKT